MVPGCTSEDLVEVCTEVYGLNTAPKVWHRCLKETPLEQGWVASELDPCWFLLRVPVPGEDTGDGEYQLDEGLRFAIREGGRTVGAGVVSKIIE